MNEVVNNYVLLLNYNENILYMRGFVLKTAIQSIKQIEKDEFMVKISTSEEKRKLITFFQMEVISGIMMYIEDLVILAESFRRRVTYYKLLDASGPNPMDVGEIIRGFFENLNSFSDVDLHKILGCAYPEELNMDDEEKKVVKRVLQTNITTLRELLVQIGEFGNTHHPAFRRFKHGGAPLIPGAFTITSEKGVLSDFDFHTPISHGPDPLEDIIVIPFSRDVLEGYECIIGRIQNILKMLLRNHISRIEYDLSGILPIEFFQGDLTEEEKSIYDRIVRRFYPKYQHRLITPVHAKMNSNIDRKRLAWYLNLPNFLTECRKNRINQNSDT